MKLFVLSFIIIFVIRFSQAEENEDVKDKTFSLESIEQSPPSPKRTVKRSAYGYGYGYSPYSYGGYYGFGYPYLSYYSSPYRIGYPYHGLYGGYGGYGYYGW